MTTREKLAAVIEANGFRVDVLEDEHFLDALEAIVAEARDEALEIAAKSFDSEAEECRSTARELRQFGTTNVWEMSAAAAQNISGCASKLRALKTKAGKP